MTTLRYEETGPQVDSGSALGPKEIPTGLVADGGKSVWLALDTHQGFVRVALLDDLEVRKLRRLLDLKSSDPVLILIRVEALVRPRESTLPSESSTTEAISA